MQGFSLAHDINFASLVSWRSIEKQFWSLGNKIRAHSRGPTSSPIGPDRRASSSWPDGFRMNALVSAPAFCKKRKVSETQGIFPKISRVLKQNQRETLHVTPACNITNLDKNFTDLSAILSSFVAMDVYVWQYLSKRHPPALFTYLSQLFSLVWAACSR